MEIKHVQAELAPVEYRAFQAAARDEGLSLKQAAHEAMVSWSRQKSATLDPLHGLIGLVRKGPADASERVDDIYRAD